MKIIFKITFIISLVVTLNACVFPPKVKVVATARVVNPLEMNEAISALEKRMEKFNIPAVISKLNETDIRLELLTEEGTDGLKKNLLSSTKLEFYETVPADWIAQKIAIQFIEDDQSYPEVLDKIKPIRYRGSAMVGYVATKDTLEVMSFLKSSTLLEGNQIPAPLLKLKWGILDEQELHPLYLIKTNKLGKPEMDGKTVTDAVTSYDQIGRITIDIQMDEIGAKQWEKFTGRAAENQFQIAMMLNDVVYSAPGVMMPIPEGRSTISGDFTQEEAQNMASALKLGYLPEMELLSFEEIKE